MKKSIFLFVTVLILSFCNTAFAENAEPPADELQSTVSAPLTSNSFTLFIDVLPAKGVFMPSVLKAELRTLDGELILSGETNVESIGTAKIDFPVADYEIGTKFRLIVTGGAESVIYYSDNLFPGDNFIAETYAYKDNNGNVIVSDSAHISIVPISEPWDVTAEKFIANRNIQSKTDYLVWVSKKNFTVSVFLKRDYGWDCIKQINCSVGASKTPTITGEFTYHQYQNKWQYDGYYVGPVMRFYGGYAIHSTLINNDGTNRDARLGKRISHGCVRVLPNDARWLADYIPIGTKIYVTDD